MKLEDQVVSLELAKKLRDLGVKQESYFWWYEHGEPEWEGEIETFVGRQIEKASPLFAAFTTGELGEMLPTNFKSEKVDLGHGGKLHWTCWSGDYGNPYEREDTEADARAKMLIYLLENKLITL